MLTILKYDGTWTGLLTCVYEAYERKIGLASIIDAGKFQPDAFAEHLDIYPDEKKAKRVWAGLKPYLSAGCLKNLYSCYLSELPDIGNVIFRFIRLTFELKQSPESAFGNPTVLRVSQVAKMVYRERHRMEAFIRFRLTGDGLYYAIIEPDFNVIPLVARHFKNRYADQKWLIYDQKRSYGIYYDLDTVTEVALENSSEPQENVFHEDELKYQTLWSDYFKHVNISERKNKKLHLMHVPKRYWKHLTEKTA